jgi:hypothetical protein
MKANIPGLMNESSDIPRLQEAFIELHGCEAVHLETFPDVTVTYGQTIWEGEVALFKLVGHSSAHKGYAWFHDQKIVAVLELPPIHSAASAVHAALARLPQEKDAVYYYYFNSKRKNSR